VTPVDDAAAALRAGGVIVLPTDTVYGLVALASVASATAHLFALKQRAEDVPLAVLCASREQALGLAAAPVDPAVAAVAERWWPGPLTLVVPRRPGVDLHLGEPATTVGLRVPDDELVRAVAERVGPLAATSANRHGEPVAATAAAARDTFGASVALVVDGGRLSERSSTVVDATDSPWRVLREGPIPSADVFETARDDAG
jgi:tRNA threonylcarbamoyl adenosine modification protein (Sua5/YciO/YrdC/YwlC family)